jgi:hypothetical protein
VTEENIQIVKDLIVIPKSLISVLTTDFDKKLEIIKNKHNAGIQNKIKKG